MKIALLTDTHFGVRGDNKSYYDYFDKFFSKVFFPYIDEHDIKHCVHLGDVTDRRKFINFITAEKIHEQMIKPLMERNIETHVIIGNHDTYFKNTNKVNCMTRLYGESRYDDLYIHDEPNVVEVGDIDVLMLPWICDENEDDSLRLIKAEPATVVMGHLELKGFEMFKGVMSEGGRDSAIFKNYDAVLSGHYHHKSSTGNIHYLGAIGEYTWADYGDPRGFHIFDTSTKELEFIQNPYVMYNRFIYDDEFEDLEDILDFDVEQFSGTYVKLVVKSKSNPFWFDQVVDKLEKSDIINLQIVEDLLDLDLFDDEDIINEVEDTDTILMKYIDNLDLSIPVEPVKSFIKELHKEALTLE